MINHKHHGNRRMNGFTLVELAVVIGVLGILATVGAMSYVKIQQQSHDTQRENDMVALRSQLEKFYDENGVYPPGCPQVGCGSSFIFNNTSTSGIIFDGAATTSDLKGIFPGLSESFGDPTAQDKTTPFMDKASSDRRYLYFGGAINTGVSADSKYYPSTTSMPCNTRTSLAADETSSYIVGYYSEVEKKWNLFGGKKGQPMTITGGSSKGCVINS